jgi:hypothetical protein
MNYSYKRLAAWIILTAFADLNGINTFLQANQEEIKRLQSETSLDFISNLERDKFLLEKFTREHNHWYEWLGTNPQNFAKIIPYRETKITWSNLPEEIPFNVKSYFPKNADIGDGGID